MGPINVILWVAGVALIAIGYRRAKGPWSRYQSLKEQDANVARYEAWRGGVRDDGKTGASVAMEVLRRQAQVAAAIGDRRLRPRVPRVPHPVVPTGERRCRPLPAGDPPPLDGRAAIHHDRQAGVMRDPSRLPVDDAELEPQAACPDLHRLTSVRDAVLGASEDVDQVERARRRDRLGQGRGTPGRRGRRGRSGSPGRTRTPAGPGSGRP